MQVRRDEIGEGDNSAAGLGLGRSERVVAAARMADLPGYPHGAGVDVDASHAPLVRIEGLEYLAHVQGSDQTPSYATAGADPRGVSAIRMRSPAARIW